jgi:hypothetical protein
MSGSRRSSTNNGTNNNSSSNSNSLRSAKPPAWRSVSVVSNKNFTGSQATLSYVFAEPEMVREPLRGQGQGKVGKVNGGAGAGVVVGGGIGRSELGVGGEGANTSSSTTSLALPVVASNGTSLYNLYVHTTC